VTTSPRVRLVLTLADLAPGDLICARNGRAYARPLPVLAALAPLEPGHPVHGVRVQGPRPASPVEWVLYPDQERGATYTVERPA
jgi:hypothetical protein